MFKDYIFQNFYCVYVFSLVPDDNISKTHPVQFDRIDGPFICKTTLRMDDLQVLMLLDGNGCAHPLVHTLLISVMPSLALQRQFAQPTLIQMP